MTIARLHQTTAAWLVLALLPMAVAAQQPDVPRPDDAMLMNMLPPGHMLETRADGDLDGDGQGDVAFVGRGKDQRTLYVAFAYRSDVDFGHEVRARGPLDADPLAPATLSVARGVLAAEDLTGGTSATAATYRLRLDPKTKRMRLIGLDLKSYSRTYAHDGVEWSWNLLTGATIRRDLTLNADGDSYIIGPERRAKRAAKPIYLEALPDSEKAARLLSGGV